MAAQEFRSNSPGIAFLVSAGIVYEIIAAACSSPQTTEINADKRADTLMKWVNIGMVQATMFILLAIAFDPKNWAPTLLGGGLAGFVMYAQYVYAKDAGLRNNLPGTED